ncbi:MAG: FHA domain-containing protein [Nitrospira sp.]|uniref:FHA domain-containing protein n=1 Tax=Nitrospira defluvii TaxID=330214 RepID=A0ABM8S4D2_9BACT|nr:FHA domain-containing protein [Nitrospira defluvii]MCS6328232.1 FHA domain-containing protein [Nitrospira sp.]CAE6788260.1 FHA domain-containing protein [Nitrospira defluvii]
MSQPHSLPTLLASPPQGGVRVYEISRTPFSIGRRQDNDLCLDDIAISARHARIIAVQAVLFLEDLGSAAGTFINEQRIDRRQLHDGDNIRLGTHRLMFRQDYRAATGSTPAQQPINGNRGAVVSCRAEGKVPATDRTIGIVEILSGNTGQAQYHLTRQVSLVGAQDDAVITLTGWFAPKTAAVINRKGEGYLVSQTESGKRILINGRLMQGEQALRHGDVLEVAGITMRFLLQDRNAPSPNI